MKNINAFYLLLISLLLINCASYHRVEKVDQEKVTSSENKELEHTFYVLGNLNEGTQENQQQTLNTLSNTLKNASQNSTLLWLGNSIDTSNASDKSTQKSIEEALNPLVEAQKDFAGNTVYVPGRQDWKIKGVKGIEDIEKEVNKYFGKGSFQPKEACPIRYEEIGEDIALIFVDVQWYVLNWDHHPNINSGCKINSRKLFIDEFENKVKKARGKTTLVVMSQPLFSYGEKGGFYSASSGLKPLPIVGNFKNIIKRTGGFSDAELNNNQYTNLRIKLLPLARQNNKVIFVSAHENALQYIVQNDIPQIISGASSTTSRVRNQQNLEFYDSKTGFATLKVYKDGSSEVIFTESNTEKALYSQQVYGILPKFEKTYPVLEKDSIKAEIIPSDETSHFFLYRWILGKRYSKYYEMPVQSKVLYLDSLKGGLTPVRQGGGHQSVSLHLEGKDGKAYVMRALRKNSAQFMQAVTFRTSYMQEELENTVADGLVSDFFTGSYPYSILLADGLSEKLNIPTQNTKIYYIPKQNALQEFNYNNGDKLYMVEDHPKKGKYLLGTVPFEGQVIDTYKMLQNLQKDEKYSVDQKSFLKARLFDMLIGDWDRHEDQWKWLEYKEEDQIVYRPVPRDRDQAFHRLGDGFVAKIVLFLAPDARIVKNYCGDLKSVRAFNKEPFPLDVSFLPDLNYEDWIEQAQIIQSELTDEAIDEAFLRVPPELQDESLEKIKKYLKQRRGNLQKIAERYYYRVAKMPKIMGTDKDDYFKIEIHDNKDVEVSVYRIKDGKFTDRFHHRVFQPKDTKELWIYGLDDKDIFEVIGEKSVIKLILVGGRQNDEYKVAHHNRVYIYDYESKKNTVEEAKKHAHVRLRDNYSLNTFNYKETYEDHFTILPSIDINQDVGTKIGFTSQTYLERFKGGIKHSINANYYSATHAFTGNYSGSFPKVIGRLDLSLNAMYNGENYTMNFFGWGNESFNAQDSLSRVYNRVNMTGYKIDTYLNRGFFEGWNAGFGANYFGLKLKKDQESISYHTDALADYLFSQNHYLNLNTSVSYHNSDYNAFKTNALDFSMYFGYTQNLTHQEKRIFRFQPSLSWTYKLVPSGKLVWSSSLRSELIFGDEYEFFQSAYLGGDNGLRGYRNQRYAGKQSFSHSNDIRWVLNRKRTFILPMRIGLYGALDYGRVWVPNESSDRWHSSIGGGLLLVIADTNTINIGGFSTQEGTQYTFSLGFGF